jgi:hypothetical protein
MVITFCFLSSSGNAAEENAFSTNYQPTANQLLNRAHLEAFRGVPPKFIDSKVFLLECSPQIPGVLDRSARGARGKVGSKDKELFPHAGWSHHGRKRGPTSGLGLC